MLWQLNDCMSIITCVQVCPTNPQYPSAITLAEKSGQTLQTELLRLNEFTGNGQVVDLLAINLTCMLLMVCVHAEVPPYQPQVANRRSDTFIGKVTHHLTLFCLTISEFIHHFLSLHQDEEEELHGKLEEDRFLFSLENNSAVCDVLDLREVLSVFLSEG